MAGSPANVTTFLASLKEKLKENIRKEKAELLALKQKEDQSATELDPWDLAYYKNILKKEKYAIDKRKVQEYFPLIPSGTGCSPCMAGCSGYGLNW